jgi:uncharacterized membrane protein
MKKLSSPNQSEEELKSDSLVIQHLAEEIKSNPVFKGITGDRLKSMLQITMIKLKQSSFYAGPIPDSAQFADYERALPGTGNRIIEMAENNRKDRSELNKLIVTNDVKRSRIGQYMGFVIAVLLIVGAVLCSYNKDTITAGILGASSIFSGIISMFVLGKK